MPDSAPLAPPDSPGRSFRPRFTLVAVAALLAVAVSIATRLVLLVVGIPRGTGVGGVLAALGVGVVEDLLAALWMTLPLTLYLALLRERWFQSKWQRRLLYAGMGLYVFAILFVAVAEYFFFDEFNGRFNFVAVDYLVFPGEVSANVWQSYPTGRLIAGMVISSIAVVWALRARLRRAWEGSIRPLRRWAFALGHLGLAIAATVLVSPRFTEVSQDRAVNELGKNGYVAFASALAGSDAPYEGLYATGDPEEEFARLRALLAEPAATVPASIEQPTLRRIRALSTPRPMNVVIVLEESLGSEFIGALHPRPVSLTPEYDALAGEGTLFTHAYSTGNRTIRALEATTASLPPLPGISIVRRDQSKDLFTLPALLRDRGYSTMFVYGGRALFDGMGKYLTSNGVDKVVDQPDYPPGTFTTAWGVADEAIFDQATREMDAAHATGKPFYALVLSVSNHRPFTFPVDHIQPLPQFHRRENVVRYADWALGRFIREAKKHAFFADTLFVLMGDHGARVYGAAEIPLPSYEVPILFLAPGVIPAGAKVETLMSSLDVPPTVLGVLGLDYDSKFFGHDALRIPKEAGRALMTHNNEIALLRGSRIAVLGLHASKEVFDVLNDTTFVPVAREDAESRRLIGDAIAYFHAADRLYRGGKYGFAPRR